MNEKFLAQKKQQHAMLSNNINVGRILSQMVRKISVDFRRIFIKNKFENVSDSGAH
jgi:hypothetical protein